MELPTIRKMSRSELDTVIAWAASEGWNPGIDDAECFYETDPEGFFIATDENNNPVGAISAVSYDDKFGFIGLYIVKPEYRGHLIGPMLGQRAVEYLGNRNVGLDGVEKKVKNYEARGFKLAYHNIRYEGYKKFAAERNKYVQKFNGDMEELLAFDRKYFPALRGKFISKWLGAQNSETLCIYENKKLKAYGVIRKCLEGFKIGPLFSDTSEYAVNIFLGLLSTIPANSKFYLDIPEVNKDSLRLAASYKMRAVFGTARMYNKETPEIAVGKIYGITTFELG